MLSRYGLGRMPLLAPRLQPATIARRPLSVSQLRTVYPEEGVFQKNSPRYVPGFGPAPPVPTQTHPYQEGPAQPYEPQQQRTWRSRLPRWYNVLGGAIFMFSGMYGLATRLFLLVPYEEIPDEDEEGEEGEIPLEVFFEELDALPIVQQLRSSEVFVEGEGMKPEWQEWTAYEGFGDREGDVRLTTGPLGGPEGVAAQKVFWNAHEGRLFLFVRFGPNTQGWPHVVHGGVVSTICDEALGRLTMLLNDNDPVVTANLEVAFLDLVRPGQWHLLIAELDEQKKHLNTERKKHVNGTLLCCGEAGPLIEGHNILEAHPHATTRGLFIIPKGTQLQKLPTF